MRVRLFGILSLSAFALTFLAGTAAAQAPAVRKDMSADVRALAERIDKMIEARWKEAGVKPAPPAGDHQFFRRLSIDLNGRIPSLTDLRDFIEDDAADKRPWWIDRVLDNKDNSQTNLFPQHFAAVMRSWMLTGNNANFQIQGLQPGFEGWLNEHLTKNTPYDQMVRELITSAPQGRGGLSPTAFFLDNENKPENLASATSRVFLGVKLECAQCHPHPFAKWTKNQFWEYAAFFSGFNRFAPNRGRQVQPAVLLNTNEIKIPGTDKVVKAKFLDGKDPQFKAGEDPRTVLVDWMVAAENPFFARAAVDHLWSYFFGVSLLEPIMEPADDGMPTHPQLLDMLAKEFRASGHDLRFMIRAIVNTKAYQRGSASPHAGKDDVVYFSRMPVRGMSPEQLYDSVAEATDLRDQRTTPQQFQPQPFNQQTPRREFISRFSSQDKRTESQTSILQALFMMNGKFLADRTRSDRNESPLKTIATQPTSTARKVDTLYFMTLSRAPRQEELDRLVRYVESGGPTGDPARALSDIYWALLNCGEFCLNH